MKCTRSTVESEHVLKKSFSPFENLQHKPNFFNLANLFRAFNPSLKNFEKEGRGDFWRKMLQQ
jgi:hypothetical protein